MVEWQVVTLCGGGSNPSGSINKTKMKYQNHNPLNVRFISEEKLRAEMFFKLDEIPEEYDLNWIEWFSKLPK